MSSIQIRFVPKPGYPVNLNPPGAAVALPILTKPAGLGEIFNKMLNLIPPRKFKFWANFGEDDAVLIKKNATLNALVESKGRSVEEVLEIQFSETSPKPTPELICEHDDWVSCVAVDSDGYAFTGSYDGACSLWNVSGESGEVGRLCSAIVNGLPIKACTWMPKTPQNVDCQGRRYAIASSKDRTLTAYLVDREGRLIQPVMSYEAHTDSVESVAAAPSGARFVSGSWDKNVNVWHLRRDKDRVGGDGDGDEDEDEDEQASKRRKKSKKGKGKGRGRGRGGGEVSVEKEKAPIATLRGHTECVSGVAWSPSDERIVWSGSWDHSIRQWDIESGNMNCVSTLASSKAASVISCISVSPDGSTIVSGHSDHTVRVWDPRADSEVLVKAEMKSKSAKSNGWVSAVAHHPVQSQSHIVASVNHSGVVSIWDLRSSGSGSTPVQSTAVHSDKGLCLAWYFGDADAVASGGSDKRLVVTRAVL